ncbi:MAG: Hint domain-containing protein [Pseudomonadota bacterium]
MTIETQRPDAEDMRAAGCPADALVMTLDGLMPALQLNAGQRLLTRDGVRKLLSVEMLDLRVECVWLAAGSLGPASPSQAALLPAQQRVFLRDWRAQMFGHGRAAMVPLAHLVDDDMIKRVGVKRLSLVRLRFNAPQVVYAGGLELACATRETLPKAA